MITIDWIAFLEVFVAALLGAVTLGTFYALGLRMLVRAGRAPVVAPAEFTDAITIISEKEARRAEKAAAKAARKSPLTDLQKRVALYAACDRYLHVLVHALEPEWVIGVGKFTEQRAREALRGLDVRIASILHPSPASPAANRGWAEQAGAQLATLGLSL